MAASRGKGLFALAMIATLALAAPLVAQVSSPLDIVPLLPAPETPDGEPPAPPGAIEEDMGAAVREQAVEIATVRAIDPEAVGLYEEAEGGFGFDMWRGSSRPLVERLLPRLPAGITSRAINALTRRLLLSTAQPPEGPQGANMLALRVERLATMGAGVAMNHLLRAVPPRLYDPALARARLDALLLTSDHVGACNQARELVRREEAPYWDKVLIFCQALNGQHDAAAMGVALLHERGAGDDPAFGELLRALAGDADVAVSRLQNPTALHFAMLSAARVSAPAAAVETASPAIARAFALSANLPVELRLRAAERAEAMGALPTESLAEIYASVPFTREELSSPLTRAETDKGPVTRALLYQSVGTQVVPAARAEVLEACWELGRKSGGWEGFATAARVTLDSLLTLTPSPEIVWVAGDAARALLAARHPAAARAWLELAEGQAVANAGAAAAAVDLWPLVRLADGSGAFAQDGARLVAWWEAQKDVPAEVRRRRATMLYSLLTALGEDVPVALLPPLIEGPAKQWSKTLVPVLAQRLAIAAAHGQTGETVLLALLALDPTVLGPPGPLALEAAISALTRLGLTAEAREVAVEAALASGI